MTPENRIVDTPAAEATAPEGDASAELQPNDYATGFVAGFIGSANLLPARVERILGERAVIRLAADRPAEVPTLGGSFAAGEAATLMIRPERLRLRTAGESGEDDNAVAMTVDDVINYGDSILVLGQTHGLPLRARLMGGQTVLPPRGGTLHLAWAPHDAHVLARPVTTSAPTRTAPC